MNLRAKKQLAAKTFGVGKSRIAFVNERIEEIKEAITKQDMRNLQKDGAIIIKEIKGRGKNTNKGRKRGVGKVRIKVNTRKRDYVILTRKLRKVLADKKRNGEMSREEIKEIREKIRNKLFKSKSHLKENLGGFENENPKTKKKRK
jgi:large subunit ribosomal protein L19e